MLTPGRYANRNLLNTKILDYTTSTPIMNFDYATSSNNEWTGETVYARGGDGNPRRVAFNGDKESTLTFETQIFTMEHLALLAGEQIKKGKQDILKSEVLTVAADKTVTLSKTPLGSKDKVSAFLYVNGVIADVLEVKTLAGKVITFADNAVVTAGQDVEVYYQFEAANASKLSFTAKGFPGYVKLVGDTLYADEIAGEMVPMQMTYYKAKLQPNFTLNMSPTGDPTSITLVFDIFPVKVDGVDTMADMVIYEDEA